MLLLYIHIFWRILAISGSPFNTYDPNNHLDGHCLSYYLEYEYDSCNTFCHNIRARQIMSYCLRPAGDNYSSEVSNFQRAIHRNMTFAQLRQQNITSEMLLSWSASIDIAERYQIFLNTYSNLSSENEVVFYNCTTPWFGPFCRFIFGYSLAGSFEDIVDEVFRSKSMAYSDPQLTCYIHLTCQTLLSCLDWREICDRKQDCLDGADEENCWQLEMNECNDDEYRCSNGQCIPWEYYRDGSEQIECLDRTDELPFYDVICYQNPRFKCEEHTCRPGTKEFPCGDGECIHEMSRCQNGRSSVLPRNFCTNMTLCFLNWYEEVDYEWCALFCFESDCVKDNCSMTFEFRYLPLLFGHVRYIISNETIASNPNNILPDYICYDPTLCVHFLSPTASFDHLTCHHFSHFGLRYGGHGNMGEVVSTTKTLFRGCLTTSNETYHCNSSTRYQCLNSSKCISKHRLLDGTKDCLMGDDEAYNQSCSLPDIRQRFKCRGKGNEKCFTLSAMHNTRKECHYGEDEFEHLEAFARTHISFPTICDGVTSLLPIYIDGKDQTDETDCEPWECNNTYSRCDQIWLCKNGADEIDCPYSTCSTGHHSCVFVNDTSNVSCLPIDRAGNDIDDCIGGIDERTKNRLTSFIVEDTLIEYRFRCQNDTKLLFHTQLCDNNIDCPLNDDEAFCEHFSNFFDGMCQDSQVSQNNVEKFLCEVYVSVDRNSIILFRLHNVLSYPSGLVTDNASIVPSTQMKSRSIAEDSIFNLPSDLAWACNRGVPIRSPIDEMTSTLLCLCPPSYYGDRCQYQNQRVSLTLQIRLASDWRTIFVFLITLIDTEMNIQSHEHIEYIPTQGCPIKHDIYLLYATRPKNLSKTFSVRIDAFMQMTLNYRASWIFPLQFAFLPVHRLAVLLRVPFSRTILAQQKCSPPCIHGQCSPYVNDQNATFCHCESGWSGTQCDIKLKCECASNAVCVSDSICLCPPGRWGSRCQLSHSICHSDSCINGGQCIPLDARHVSYGGISSICLCPEGYTGQRCQHRQNQTRIDISFHHKLTIQSSLLVHFIAVRSHINLEPNRTSIAKKLQFDQQSVTLYTPTVFNIALVQMLTSYYLIILSEKTITKTHISTEVIPTYRCRSLAELFSDTFIEQHLLKRIKSYHLPCQQHRELVCFYDDVHLCLCTLDRSANCLEFDLNMTYECEKSKYCGTEGQCFQDDFTCPTSSLCACQLCSFGSRCQFSTKGSTLSLDIILGYHFHSEIGIIDQPPIVKTAIALTTMIFAVGSINGFLSFQTFRRKEIRSVGCGLYLLTTSVVSTMTVVVLALKFALLVASQVGSLDNRWFLRIQCTSMDFLLRSLLSISDWLSACVAIERAVNAIQGVKFSKTKSKRMARWVTAIVIVLTSGSYIYDPVHRRVRDDEEEQRTWCVTNYSSFVQVFDWIMNIVHFSLPVAINGISAVTVIMVITRTRSNLQKRRSFKEHFYEQFHQHKHLLISPLILLVLALPRLVISLLSGCMGSARESWFYLIGYYISFIPAVMTLVVFILPSELYKKELRKAMKRVWHR